MFRDVNPMEWSNVVKLMKDSPLWEEIRKKYPELKTDEEIADEVLAHFSGKRGAERLRQAQQEAMKEKGVSAKASAISAIERVRKALSTFWKGVCDLLHIHFTNAEEVADRVLSDMLNGVDPVKVKNEAKNTWYEESKFKTLRGEDAENELQTILSSKEAPKMPVAISDLANFKEVFKNPVRTVLGKLIKVKDAVYNKMLRNNRTSISGAVMPTLTNADFIIQEIDGSTLYFKRFQNEKSEDVYNIAVVNKNDEIEDYISSVHIKSNNNIINKIKNGAELLIPDNRNGYGENSPSNSTPSGANLGRNTESGKNSEGNLHYRDENGVETKATSATDPKSKTSRATEISEHLNTPVRVITSEKEMEGLSPRQKKAKGWYNTATGEVVVLVPNNADVADVENTVLHEVIGHDGIRDLRL